MLSPPLGHNTVTAENIAGIVFTVRTLALSTPPSQGQGWVVEVCAALFNEGSGTV
jgi:hypothetical protein